MSSAANTSGTQFTITIPSLARDCARFAVYPAASGLYNDQPVQSTKCYGRGPAGIGALTPTFDGLTATQLGLRLQYLVFGPAPEISLAVHRNTLIWSSLANIWAAAPWREGLRRGR
ncbi:MAG: hypothetical protein QOF42_3305 [Gammaproteobacteria bacterium]|jgi:hypothetical protein|nr:hypothetical protein [Gammaproteobacteria bacterium]